MMQKRRTHTVPVLTAGLAVLAGTAGAMTVDSELFEPPVRLEAGGEVIDVNVGHAAPFVCDFDGDGVRDLLVGEFGEGAVGKLRIYRNAGSNKAPKYETMTWFKAEHEYGTVPTG